MNAGIQTALEYLNLATQQAAARLSELDTLPLDQRARMTYTDGNQQYGWNEYRAALVAQIDKYGSEVEELYKANQIIEGPFTIIGGAGFCG